MTTPASKGQTWMVARFARFLCAFASACICAILFVSCASLKVSREISTSTTGWTMYGKDSSHSSMSGMISTSIKEKWINDVGGGFGNCSPTIEGGIVYVGTLNGDIYAFDVATGKELGSKKFGGAISSGPAIVDSMLVVASSQSKINIFGYDIFSGKIIWSKHISDVESAPVVCKSRIFVATLRGDLYAMDPQTGDEIFHEHFDAPIRSSPAADDSICVFGSDDGNVYAISMIDGKLRWKYDAGSPVWCSPSLNDSSVFVGTNGGKLLELSKEGKLKFEFKAGEKILSMPVADDSRVYFGCNDGNFYAINIESGALVWKVQADAPIVTSAAQTRTQIIFGGFDGNLYVIDKDDGKVAQKIKLSGRIRTAPAIYGNYLVVGAEDTNVYGFLIR